MGGRGAASSSGYYGKNGEKKYGSEYHSVWEHGNIKFIKPNFGRENTPMETMPDKIRKPNGRVYVIIDKKGKPHSISFYDDKTGKRTRTLDFSGHTHKNDDGTVLGRTHVHHGYEHAEHGTTDMTQAERRYTAQILRLWRKHKKGII